MNKISTMPRTLQQLFDLSGKTALINGGSRGVGLQMAHALGEAGARLMLCARLADGLEAACADLQAAGLDARWVAADDALEADLQKLVNETLQRMGDIDILVNSASLHSMAGLSQLVARQSMIGRGGHIINRACNASKGEVFNLTGTLAGEWGQHGINVNAILAIQGDDEDLKGATVLLASDAGKHITGQCLVVDGSGSLGAGQ